VPVSHTGQKADNMQQKNSNRLRIGHMVMLTVITTCVACAETVAAAVE